MVLVPAAGSILAGDGGNCRKNSKRFMHESPGHRSSTNITNFTDLGDSLLIEVLHRLPLKSALQSRSVCKRWRSLIPATTTPHNDDTTNTNGSYFLKRFIDHTRCRRAHQPPSQHYAFTFSSRQVVMTPAETPWPERGMGGGDWTLLATSDHGLVLYAPRYDDELTASIPLRYLVFNPLTNESVLLPPAPRPHRYDFRNVAFISDAHHRFKLVRLRRVYRDLKLRFNHPVEMFSSETGEWRDSDLPVLHPKGKPLRISGTSMSNPVFYNGRPYWINGFAALFCYDPDENVLRVVIDSYPEGSHGYSDISGLCLSGGSLWCYAIEKGSYLRIWQVVFHGSEANWVVKHSVDLKELTIVGNSSSNTTDDDDAELLKRGLDEIERTRVLALHPDDPNLVYLSFVDYSVALCDLRGRMLLTNVVPTRHVGKTHSFSARARGSLLGRVLGTYHLFAVRVPVWPCKLSAIAGGTECHVEPREADVTADHGYHARDYFVYFKRAGEQEYKELGMIGMGTEYKFMLEKVTTMVKSHLKDEGEGDTVVLDLNVRLMSGRFFDSVQDLDPNIRPWRIFLKRLFCIWVELRGDEA